MQIHEFSGEELEDIANEFFMPQISRTHPNFRGRVALHRLGEAVTLSRSHWGRLMSALRTGWMAAGRSSDNLRRTLTSRGRVRVEGLADEVGWSRERLWSRFRSQLGITPKRAARLVRFDHAAHLLAAGHAAAGVAAESGYVDQSHLHREVKEFAGLTPTAVATAPWLAIDDVAWPASSPTRSPATDDAGGPQSSAS